MHIAIIIFVVILLVAIIVMINFADSDVPKLVRLIVSLIAIIILAGGVYYLTAPISTVTSASTETMFTEIPDTAKETVTAIPKETMFTEIPDTAKETVTAIPKETVFTEIPDTAKETVTAISKETVFTEIPDMARETVIAVSEETVENKYDSLINANTPVKQKEKRSIKKKEPAYYPMGENTPPPIIEPQETGNAGNTSAQQTKITSVEFAPKPDDLEDTVDITKEYGKYKVTAIAYFHNKPDENTRRNAFIIHWNKAVLTALSDRNDFIYVTFTNHLGQTSKGWLRKSDLKKVNE